MKNLIKIEELALFVTGIFWFSTMPYAWYWFPILILLPDLSMIGYLAGNKIGAWSYNIFHHRALALAIFFIGFWQSTDWMMVAGTILFSHIAMDRMLGYGLKYENGFKFTHLGEIGQKNN